MLKKYKPNGKTEFRKVYFNLTTKTVINHKLSLENAFQDILHRTDNWITEYINISTYMPLNESSYVKLPAELRSPKKGLISINNYDQKYFLWCHIRLINPVKIYPERITQKERQRAC